MMYDITKIKGTYKGIVGEALFKSVYKRVIITQFFSYYRFFYLFSKVISQDKLKFLKKYWYSLDGIYFDREVQKIILYEIKTRNYSSIKLGYVHKMTRSTVFIYNSAIKLGFRVKVATVVFYKNGFFDIRINDFKDSVFSIDREKYDNYTKIFWSKRRFSNIRGTKKEEK